MPLHSVLDCWFLRSLLVDSTYCCHHIYVESSSSFKSKSDPESKSEEKYSTAALVIALVIAGDALTFTSDALVFAGAILAGVVSGRLSC